MRRRTLLRAFAVCVVGAPMIMFPARLVLAQSAQDKADAETLFNAGRDALAAGNVAEACPKLLESQKRDPAIGTALYLAECYERLGKYASAWAQFRQAEDMANQRRDNRASIAKARADRLSPSKLSVVLAPGADVPGLEVRRDGEIIGSAQLGLASPIDGGKHLVVASAPGHKSFEWSGEIPDQRGAITVTIPKLDATAVVAATATVPVPTVTATTTATPTDTAATPPPDKGTMTGLRVAGLVIGGVGLAVVGVGGIFGLVAKSTYDSSQSSCPDPNAQTCNSQAGVDTRNTAFGQAAVSTALFIGGGVSLVGGLLLFLVAPKHKQTTALSISPLVTAQGGGAFLSGRF